MLNRQTLTLASLLAAALLFASDGAAAPNANISNFKLANGLEVVVIPDRRTPVITHMVWYKIGSADEPAGKSGIAHFLEHLMFKGTKKNPIGKFSKAVAAIGGQENAFTTADYTGYYQRASREHLKMLMEFEADRMTGLVLTDKVVKPELNVVLEEQNQRVANSPGAKLSEQLEAALYLNHPYGKPMIGWRHEIEKLNREDALEFYRRFYTPNNAVLVVAGDVTADEVKALAQATFGKVKPRAKITPRQRPQEPEQNAVRHIELADPRVAQPSLQRYYLVPSAATAKPGEARSARRARPYSRRRHDQPALSLAGGGARGRHQRGRLVPGRRARRDPFRRLRHAEAGGDAAATRGGDRRGDRRSYRQRCERRRTRARQEPANCRHGLRPGQSGNDGALVRRRVDHRINGRAGHDLARSYPRRERAIGAGGCAGLAGQTPLGHRLPRQGRNETGGKAHVSMHFSPRIMTAAAALLGAALISQAPADATTIERVVSPGGIEAWLVRESSVPLIAMDFAFKGGADQDAADKPGVGYMTTALLDDGAGDLDAKAFQQRLEENAIEMRFSTGRSHVLGSVRMLKERQEQGFELLRLALTVPRFDADALERVRAQMLAGLRRETTSPNAIASRTWWKTAFPDHPYGRPMNGTLESVPQISADDLKTYARRVFARDTLKVSVVGDIDAAALGKILDAVFGALPAKAELNPVAAATMQAMGRRIVVDLDVPQAVLSLGGVGLARKDPDFITAYVVNHILGGGSFTSRLYDEVREKRGLVYGVSSYLLPLDYAALVMANTATNSDRAGETLGVIEKEIRRLAEEGPTAAELAKAKAYLKGSFVLRFDTSTAIASQLLQIQIDELGIDYINKRNKLIEAVTLADAKRVAKRLFSGDFLVTVVGRPKGLVSKEPGG